MKSACLVLLVPVVDLVDVAKHDFVFSLHVIRDALLLHPAHVALIMKTHRHKFTPGLFKVKHINTCPILNTNTATLTKEEAMRKPRDFQIFKTTNEAAGEASTHLHHLAKVSDIISLRLDELQENIAAAQETQKNEN